VDELVQDAMRFAESSPEPAHEALYEDLYVESYGA
jgi:TPP-dependent pyruvate/acetoin dehydrogenase alpha subunit